MKAPETLGVVFVAAIVTGVVLYMLDEPRPLAGPVRETPRRPDPPPPDPLPPKREAPKQPEDGPPPPAPTRFVTRLLLGDSLMALRARGSAVPIEEIRAEIANRSADILAVDGAVPANPWMALDFLCEPRRDMGVLWLANEHAEAHGADLTVRVWTLGTGYPAGRIASAAALIHQLEAFAGVRISGGIDVLVTPGVGADLFPRGVEPSGKAGIYFPEDEFCAVKSTLGSGHAAVVLRHELVHAFLGRFAPDFCRQRFVSEGLAEYLRLLEPGDSGIDVAVERLADDLASLDRALTFYERCGFRFELWRPRRLVMLDPARFYFVPLGYELAQAAMAFVGNRVIGEAIGKRSDWPIVEAVAGIRWHEFREFVRANAKKGRAGRARPVADAERPPEELRGVLEEGVLEEIGILVNREVTAVEKVAEAETRSTDRLREVVGALLGEGGQPVVAADLSSDMDSAMPGLSLPDAGITAATPRDFVAALLARLSEPRFLGIVESQQEVVGPATQLPYDPGRLAETLAARGLQECNLIVCAATRHGLDPAQSAARVKQHLDRWERWGIHPASVLVIDFSGGAGDATLIARAFASRRLGFDVALWQPSPR